MLSELGDAGYLGLNSVLTSHYLHEECCCGVHGQTGIDVALYSNQTQLIHHLYRGRNDPGRNNVTDQSCSVIYLGEVHEQRCHMGRIGGEAHTDCGSDTHHALTADKDAAEVQSRRFRVLSTKDRDAAIRENNFEGQNVRGSDTLGQTVRTTRIVGHIAPDGADLLTAGIGSEMKAMVNELGGQIQIQKPGLNPSHTVVDIHAQDRIHFGDGDDNCIVKGHRSPS